MTGEFIGACIFGYIVGTCFKKRGFCFFIALILTFATLFTIIQYPHAKSLAIGFVVSIVIALIWEKLPGIKDIGNSLKEGIEKHLLSLKRKQFFLDTETILQKIGSDYKLKGEGYSVNLSSIDFHKENVFPKNKEEHIKKKIRTLFNIPSAIIFYVSIMTVLLFLLFDLVNFTNFVQLWLNNFDGNMALYYGIYTDNTFLKGYLINDLIKSNLPAYAIDHNYIFSASGYDGFLLPLSWFLILILAVFLSGFLAEALTRHYLVSEADVNTAYNQYLEKLREIAVENLAPEAHEKQQELIVKEDKKIQAQRAREQKEKEALAAKRKQEERERQEQEEFESKLSDLHSDIMKSSGEK